ncbi:MAG: ornithine cyclodeaminase family protein, partial [Deltaproteobacteria bacterium]|nr:ornithine cyclodeaminase family protein [Deltaproteobacteria bacterium]
DAVVIGEGEGAFAELGRNPLINAPRRRIYTGGTRATVHQGASPDLDVTGLRTHCERLELRADVQQYLHSAPGVSVLYRISDGSLVAIIVGAGITVEGADLRSAAVSAVGTRHLMKPGAAAVGLLGTGTQARTHLLALKEVMPLQAVRVYGRDPERRRAFCAELARRLGVEVRPEDSPRGAVEGMDVIVTATNSNVPVFDGRWLTPGAHVTSIVADDVGLVKAGLLPHIRRELDDETIRRADVIVALSREQAVLDEQGDLYEPVQAGVIRWEQVHELGEVLTGRAPGRATPQQITLFKNNGGQGVSDVAIAARLYEKARVRGLGLEVPV